MSMFATMICPFCGTKNEVSEAALEMQDGEVRLAEDKTIDPQRGDPTICGECGEWAIFDLVPGGCRKPNDGEYLVIGLNPATQMMREAWLAMVKAREAGD